MRWWRRINKMMKPKPKFLSSSTRRLILGGSAVVITHRRVAGAVVGRKDFALVLQRSIGHRQTISYTWLQQGTLLSDMAYSGTNFAIGFAGWRSRLESSWA